MFDTLAYLFDQRLPRRQVRGSGNDENISRQTPSKRQHHRHRIRRRHPLQRRLNPLLSLQGRRRLPRADHLLPARRHRRPHQRHLPRPHRDGHDGRRLRGRARARQREEDWPAESYQEGWPRR